MVGFTKFCESHHFSIRHVFHRLLVIILIEWISKNILHSEAFISGVKYIFGEGQATINFLLIRASSYSLQGFMREPSHLGASLFNFGIIILISHYSKSDKKKILFFISIILFISGSFRGSLNGITLWILYLALNSNFLILYTVSILMIIIVFPIISTLDFYQYYLSRFVKALDTILQVKDVNLVDSELRVVSIIETYKVFLERPILGIGLGTTYAFGFLPSMLATTGIAGLLSWFEFLFLSVGQCAKNRKNYIVILAIIATWNLQGKSSQKQKSNLYLKEW